MNAATEKRISWARLMFGACCGAAVALGALSLPVLAAPKAAPPKLDSATCQTCHDGKDKLTVPTAEGKPRPLLGVTPDKFAQGVHGKMECVACHTEIVDAQANHKKNPAATRPDCATCHRQLSEAAPKVGAGDTPPRRAVVAKNAEAYAKSFHARPNKDDPSKINAQCTECHDTHFFNVPTDRTSPQYLQWRRAVPQLCGKCHEEQIEAFNDSVHGKQISEKTDAKGAICIDCHTTHEITGSSLASFKLLLPEECGNCHKANLRSYRDTYHGQVTKLGETHTAKCYDCHGSHDIAKVGDKQSKVHPDNRLKTCKSCHDGKKATIATAGFTSFSPHAHAGDFAKYPQMWIASKFMIALLAGVFAFFWAHSGLWYYREWQDRKNGVTRPFVKTAGLNLDEEKHVRRFGAGWRIAHLLFALTTMTLVLTGTAALYADSFWAPAVAKAVGGAKHLALTHRVAATIFIAIFFLHFVYVMQHLLRKKGFRWFGPDSLVPRWQDFFDIVNMFKWFVGRGTRPSFERWAYYEKFDYWAVFWGVSIIGGSGLMLAFPSVTASYLPGWVFNVATLVHGEEAFLAAVFLFTVHFFNNHFRPDKLPPPDVVMFTGTQSLEEFRHDHPAHYNRLVESGDLEKYLVDAPSRPMTVGSKILGLTLIAIGLVLLVLVLSGFLGGAMRH